MDNSGETKKVQIMDKEGGGERERGWIVEMTRREKTYV